jgi:hypothetical protein
MEIQKLDGVWYNLLAHMIADAALLLPQVRKDGRGDDTFEFCRLLLKFRGMHLRNLADVIRIDSPSMSAPLH